jgi:hypothetical protein
MIELQDLLFTLLNLGLVILAIIYIVQNYLLPQLKDNILTEQIGLVEMHEEHRRLANEQEKIENDILLQEDHAKILFKKINQWRNLVEMTLQADLLEHQNLIRKSEERRSKSARNYFLHKTYDMVAPLVVKTLEQDFKKKFADPQEGHSYLTQVLKKLPE